MTLSIKNELSKPSNIKLICFTFKEEFSETKDKEIDKPNTYVDL